MDKYYNRYSVSNQFRRFSFQVIWNLLKIFPRSTFNFLRIMILRLYGAKVAINSKVYSSAIIWEPRNLILECNCCIGPDVLIYNPGKFILGQNSTISQYTKVYCATHNYKSKEHELIITDVIIGSDVWVASEVSLIGPINIEDCVVIGIKSLVINADLHHNSVYVGNPAKKIGNRYEI